MKILKGHHTLALLLIVLGVLLANSIYIFAASPNPLLQKSNLAVGSSQGIVIGQHTIDPNDGFTSQALGNLAARDWLHGKVPYWNPYEGVGAPLAGEMQNAAFSPLTLLLAFSNGLFYAHMILEMIAGVATYFLLIKLRLSRKVALFGGLAFALNGTFAWLANAPFNPIAFLPVVLLGVELAYGASVKQRKRGWILLAFGLAASLYAGFPETAYIDGLLCFVWAVTRLFQLEKEFRKDFLRKLVLGGTAGVLLAMPALVSFYDYYKYANVGLHAQATTIGLAPLGLSSLIMPYIYGPIFGQYSYDGTQQLYGWWSSVGGYITVALLALAIIGVAGKKQRPLKLVLGAWILIVAARTYGFFHLAYVLNLIPGIKSAAFYRYAPPSFEFALVVLAAFGVSELAAKRATVKTRTVAAAAMSLIITLAIIRALPTLQHLAAAPASRRWAALSIMAAVISVLLIFLAQFIGKRRLRENALIIVALAEVAVMFMVPQLSAPRHVKLDTSPVTYLQHNLGSYRFTTFGPIQPNYGSYYSIAEINTNDLPIPKLWSDYVSKNLDSNTDPLIFTGGTMKDPHGLTPLQAFTRNISAYEQTGVKYLVTPQPLPVATISATGIKQVFHSPSAYIYQLPNPKPYFEVLQRSCNLQPASKEKLTVDCKTPSILLRRELFMKGWTAKVDNHTVPISDYGRLFQQINVPAGRHTVTYRYLPPHMYEAYALLLLGLGIIVAGLVASRQADPTAQTRPKVKQKD